MDIINDRFRLQRKNERKEKIRIFFSNYGLTYKHQRGKEVESRSELHQQTLIFFFFFYNLISTPAKQSKLFLNKNKNKD